MTFIASMATAAILVTFAVAAASKLRSRQAFVDFAVGLGDLGLRGATAATVAFAVVALEAALCVALVAGLFWWPAGRTALVAAALLLVAFTGFIVRASRRTDGGFACRCFGSDEVTDVPVHVAANLALAVLALAGAVVPVTEAAPGTVVLGLGLGALLGGAAVAAEVLVDTFRLGSSATRTGESTHAHPHPHPHPLES
ncbi:MauE/DoxX family redox-associated membrane protein [Pimelobacter simplex]|uniref:MauE/DoxX family redox-associated membrane protein n=1 Tax=Nocardioides simplex TaxID=2045 RepID=UPI003AB051EC